MKGKILIIFILVFLVGIVAVNSISVEDIQNNSITTRVVGNYGVVTTGVEQPRMNGYIVQFKDEPMLPYIAELERNIREQQKIVAGYSPLYAYTLGLPKKIALMYNIMRKGARIANYRSKILDVHDSFKEKVESTTLMKNGGGQILGEYTSVFNGIALNISEDEVITIRGIPEVKAIYPNYEVHTTLYDSIPLINADDVWKLDEDGNNCVETGKECLTGKGVKVAVIDTGIDYTHPDLGGCFEPNTGETTTSFVSHVYTNDKFTIQLNQLISMGKENYDIQLDIPNYLDKKLRRPKKFFSGRWIRLINKKGKVASYPDFVILSNRDRVTKRSISEKTLKVNKQGDNYFVINIPENTKTGYYTIDFEIDNNKFYVPINIVGLTDNEKSQIKPQGEVDPSILRLRCGYCYWESVSGVNPTDENYGYFVGGGASDYLVQTIDGWDRSETYRINDLTISPPRRYRGDPKIAFTDDGTLIVASLLKTSDEPITGGLFQDSGPKNHPPQFTQTLLSTIPPDLDPSEWIIFDYEKISIDTHPNSNYYQNIYVFANAVRFMDGSYGQGLFVVNPDGEISLKKRGQGYAITSTVVGPNGELYAGYPDGMSMKLVVSFDGGQTFVTHTIVEFPIFGCSARVSTTSDRAWFIYEGPELAVNKDGVLYAAWAFPKERIEDENFEYSTYGYDYDVYVSFSTDQGMTWSDPVRVNDDTPGGDQGFPSITVDEDGIVYVAFLDHRENQDKGVFDIYISESTDGGLTFSKNMRVNDIPVPNIYGHRDPGDYLDMISVGENTVFVSYPCVNEDYIQYGKPSDGCVSKFQKPLNLGPKTPECSDGIDNDDDELIDFPTDPGCESPNDNDETNPRGLCKVIGGYDFFNNDNDPMDDNGHGTHVAGIIAAKGDYNRNNIYEPDQGEVWGVAPDVSLLAYKVLDSYGRGWSSDIIAGIEKAVSDGADVISISLGSYGYADDPMSQTVDNAVDAGVVVVVAAGNSGPEGITACRHMSDGSSNSICSPGTARKAITVGGSDDNDYVAGFSSRGPTILGLIKPDVVAPGVDICSSQWDDAFPSGDINCNNDDNHVAISGTSMATPHVAGVAALMKQKNPDWYPEEIKYALKMTSKQTRYNIINGQKIYSSTFPFLPNPSREVCTKIHLETINSADLYLLIDKNFDDFINNGILRDDNLGIPGEKIEENNWQLLVEDYYSDINQYYTTFDDITISEGEYWLCSDFTDVIEIKNYNDFESRFEDMYIDSEGVWKEPVSSWGYITDIKIGLLLVYSKKSMKNIEGGGRIDALETINVQNPPPIANFKLSNLIQKDERVSIEGTAFSENLDHYTVELVSKIDSSEVHLLKMGHESIFDGTIAENIDLSSFEGEWILKLSVTDTYDQSSVFEQEILIIDPLLQRGWPQYTIDGEVDGSFLSPVIGDLENDGDLEIVSVFMPYLGGVGGVDNIKYQAVYAWHHDGSLVQGFPIKLMNEKIEQEDGVSNPTLGDLDGDGDLEILVGTKEGIYAFDHTGGLVSGWPVKTGLQFDKNIYSYGPILADLNGDGYLEVISTLYGLEIPNYVYVFDKDGNTLLEKQLGDIELNTPRISIANLDDDQDLEILVRVVPKSGTKQREIIIYDYNGDVVMRKIIDGHPRGLTLGDVDNDGDIEIVFREDNQIVVMSNSGTIEKKWDSEEGYRFGNDLTLGDLDGDGDLEIVSHDRDEVWIWNHDGTKFSNNFPVKIPDQFNYIYDLGIGDIDSDGYNEIFGKMLNHERTLSPTSYTHSIGAWNGDGSVVDNFPLNLYNLKSLKMGFFITSTFSPTIDDVDKDGDIEFVVSNGMGRMYVLDIPTDYNQDKMDWPTYRHDYRHTGLYTKKGMNENCERVGDEDGNGLADCLDPMCPEGTYCNPGHTKVCKNRVCVPISEDVEIICETLGLEQCQVNSICECFVTNCNSGWVRAELPDNSKAIEYFSNNGFSINAGKSGGEAEAFISCRDDGKEYHTSITIHTTTECSTHFIEITDVQNSYGKISVSYRSKEVGSNVDVNLIIATPNSATSRNCPVTGGTCSRGQEKEYFLNVGESVTISGKKLTLENLDSTGRIQVNVDGVVDIITDTKVVNDLQVTVVNYFYTENEKSALLKIKPIFDECIVQTSCDYPVFDPDKTYTVKVIDRQCRDVFDTYVIQQCSDTDANPQYPDGKNIYEKGICTDAFGSMTDRCASLTRIEEIYCGFSKCIPEYQFCPNDYVCREGACVYVPPSEVTDNVPIGQSLTQVFSSEITNGMQSGSVVFQGKTYRFHDLLHLGSNSPSIESSLTSNEDDYQANVVMEADVNSINYYYIFDDAINISKASFTDPLTINFLGKELNISHVSSFDSFIGSYDHKPIAIRNGDGFIKDDNICEGDPKDTDCWVWDINALTADAVGDINPGGGPTLGVKSTFVINDDQDNPITLGECYQYPNTYAQICVDDLTVDDREYMTLTVEYKEVTLGEYRNQPTIHLKSSVVNGLQVESDYLDKLYEDVKTTDMWIRYNGTPGFVDVWYIDVSGNKILAGGVRTRIGNPIIGRVIYGNTADWNIEFNLTGSISETNQLHLLIDIRGDDPIYLDDKMDDIIIQLKHESDSNFEGIGSISNREEPQELRWCNGDGFGCSWVNIGTKDEDHRSMYGIIIKNPKEHGFLDEVVLEIPVDQVFAEVTIKGLASVSTTTTTVIIPMTTTTQPQIGVVGRFVKPLQRLFKR